MADPFDPKFADLVRNFSSTQGTGNFVLGPAVNGYTSFASALQAGDSFYYSAIGVDKPAEREVGRGTLTANGQISRSPIGGTPTNFSNGTKSIALIAAAEWFTQVQSGAGGSNAGMATRAALAAAPSSQVAALLAEPGREGLFVFDGSNLAAKVSADPAQGLFIAPASDPSGASGAWVRKFDGAVHIDWFGAAGDGTTDDTPAFTAMRTALGALATNAASGLRRTRDIRLGAKEYFLAADFDCKGFTATWRGAGGGFATWNNTGATTIRMASGKTWYFQRSNTEGNSTGTAIPFGCDGSVFYDITWRGPGKGVGTASAARMRAKISLYNCRFIEAGGHGLEINATAGAGTTSEGNANCWMMVGGACSLNGKSGLKTIGGDSNAGVSIGTTFDNNSEYGIEEASFLGNQYFGIHCDANTLGHLHGTGPSNGSEFHGYFEGGYPVSVIPPRAWASGVNSATQIDGASITANDATGSGKGCPAIGGLQTYRIESGKTINILRGAEPGTNPYIDRCYYSSFCNGGTPFVHGFQTGIDEYKWSLGVGGAEILSVNGDGSGALPRRSHGLATPPTGVISLREVYLGDGIFPDGRRFVSVTAAPSASEHAQGEFAFNRSITAASPLFAWACTSAGTPGTHTPLYALTAVPAAIATSGSGADLGAASVTYAKIQNVSGTDKLLGRATGGAGVIEEIACTAAGRALIDDADAPAQRTTLGLATIASSGSASDLIAGTVPAARMPAHTGDVTSSAGTVGLTIANGAVSLAKQADMATASVVYRKTAGSGAPEVQSLATLKTDLGLTGTNSGDQTIALTGDVTGSGAGSFAATIANNTVTYAKMQDVSATARLLGRGSAGAGDPEEIAVAGGLEFSTTTLRVGFSGTSKLLGRSTAGAGAAEEIGLAGGLAISGGNLTAAGALTPTSVASTGAITSSGGAVGYATGAGGAVTQATSKSTGVTLNKLSGQVTMNNAVLAAAAIVEFTVTDSQVGATDTVNLNLASGAATSTAYRYWVSGVAAGSFKVCVENRSAGSLSEALVLSFAVLKAVIA